MNVTEAVGLKSPYQKKNILQLFMVMDASYTYCAHHFAIYTYVESLCCIPETNIILYVNYFSIKRKILKGQK